MFRHHLHEVAPPASADLENGSVGEGASIVLDGLDMVEVDDDSGIATEEGTVLQSLFQFFDRFPVGDDPSVLQMDVDIVVLHFEIQDIRWFDPHHFVSDHEEEVFFVLPVMEKQQLIHDQGEIGIGHRLQDEIESLNLIPVDGKLGKIGDEDDGDVLVFAA